MSSKAVTDRQKSADSVIAIGAAHSEPSGAALVTLLSPGLQPGEIMPDFALGMRLLTRRLAAHKDAMVSSDTAHEAELGDDAGVREARDEASSALFASLVELREVITGVYGGATSAKVFDGPTPNDPVVLSRFAGEVASALGRVTFPAPRVQGASLDVATTAASLSAGAAGLDERVQKVAAEVREAQVTLEAKNKALATYDDTFSVVATVLGALLRAAGSPELAAKVRPSAKRPGQTLIDVGEAENEGEPKVS